MKVVAVVPVLVALFLLAGIRRELHSIHYQLTLAGCLAQADRGVVCNEAEPLEREPVGKVTTI